MWQWLHHHCALEDGRAVTATLVAALRDEELAKIRAGLGDAGYLAGYFPRAAELFTALTLNPEFESFLTLTAYREID